MTQDETPTYEADAPAIVMVRPQLAVNIGTAARAMANFDLADFRLVAPREGWPLTGALLDTAVAAAAGAAHLLETARVFPDVGSAVADLNALYATTARERGQGKPVRIPSEAMSRAASERRAGSRTGFLFGPERTGLDNDDLVLADAIVTFPVSASYSSLNVAQAILLIGYEWFKAANGDAPPFRETEFSPPATKQDVSAFFDTLDAELSRAGYFRPENKKPIMRRNLFNIFQRTSLTEQDVRTLRGMIVRLVEGERQPGHRRSKPAEDR